MSKQDTERTYNGFKVQEKEEGKALFESYARFFSMYQQPYTVVWEDLPVNAKLTWVRTMRAARYVLGSESNSTTTKQANPT